MHVPVNMDLVPIKYRKIYARAIEVVNSALTQDDKHKLMTYSRRCEAFMTYKVPVKIYEDTLVRLKHIMQMQTQQ